MVNNNGDGQKKNYMHDGPGLVKDRREGLDRGGDDRRMTMDGEHLGTSTNKGTCTQNGDEDGMTKV
jgi:hypothetical protein